MWMNVTRELAALKRMTTKELKEKYEEVFDEQCRSNHRQWLIKRIIWRIQANQEGDLSERARQRAAEIANDADLRIKAPPQKAPTTPSTAAVKTAAVSFSGDSRLPLPGAILTREYKGQTYQVTVHSNGFEWEGEIYKSLSAVANAITGTHTSGYLFFRIEKKGGSK
ncbi:DUF2924 domain-containing protein [Thalassoglobus sp.]|uniref:DUF2924 domain-containing protein n=1 Tax=Thalassoglobus sp. TaxID=2795869 RepID=UPI003AA93CE4